MDRLSTHIRDGIRAKPGRTGPWGPETLINMVARATSIGHLGTGSIPLARMSEVTGTGLMVLARPKGIGAMDTAGSSTIETKDGSLMKRLLNDKQTELMQRAYEALISEV